MKCADTIKALFAGILCLWSQIGHSQTYEYYYSGPVDGSDNGQGFVQVALTPGFNYLGGYLATFGTISETLYYNPTANTLEQDGTFSLNNSTGTFNMVSETVPQQTVGSATLTAGNNGSVAFDYTGACPPPGGSQGAGLFLTIPVTGSGTYEGQSFSGSWDIYVQLNMQIISYSATSLTFSQFTGYGPGGSAAPAADPVVQVGNQWLWDGDDDNTYYESWSQDPVTANAVPEPATFALFGLGIGIFGFGHHFRLSRV